MNGYLCPNAKLCAEAKKAMVIGTVSFLNAVPLTWALPRLGFDGEVVCGTPAELAQWLKQGRIDIGLIPIAEYLRGIGEVIVDGLGIASDGAVRSVAVFSHKPIGEVHNIAVDSGSRSSVLLLQVLWAKRFGILPPLSPMAPDLEQMLSHADAALLIGDAALRASLNASLLVWDLGAAWKELTGLPFVFAAWVARDEQIARQAASWLVAARAEGRRHLSAIIAEESERRNLPADLVQRYLTEHIRHDLTERHHQAVDLFAQMAFALGLLPSVRPVRWLMP
jgi:chorismate dehydratase